MTQLMDDVVNILESQGGFDVVGICVDCKKRTTILIDRTENDQIEIKNGAIYEPPESFGYQDKYIFKCDDCFKIDKILHQRTEVYSRVVGYLRPIKQFNPGKLAEFNLRENFALSS